MKKSKLIAFEMEFSGLSRKEISKRTNYRENTLNAYFAKKGSWYKEYRAWAEEYTQELNDQVRVKIVRASVDAVDVLVKTMRMVDKNPALALRAASAILDYAGFSKDNRNRVKDHQLEDKAEEMVQWFEHRKKLS